MKKNKTRRQLNAYYRIRSLLQNPELIIIAKTKKYRNGEKISFDDIENRLKKEFSILGEKLESQGLELD